MGELTPRTTDYVSAIRRNAVQQDRRGGVFGAEACTRRWWIPASALVTDSAHMRAAPLFEETNERLQAKVAPLVAAGKVPVMGGFIGATKAGVTTTIGRGGSDFSAAIVGAGLGAERIEIWTDVDGMMTTDPQCLS